MKEIKIGTIRGKTALKIGHALDESGIIIFKQIDECGKVLNVYTEKQHGKHTLQ